ncbi:aminopeptidase Y [Ceratobasidium sp. AG-I]|nr:aminopeptidase Y [Ceratobasidium sp. AG-I]
MRSWVLAFVAGVFFLCFEGALAAAYTKELTSQALQNAITLDGLLKHAHKWQEIADRSNGTRSSGTRGYDLSADYVYSLAKRSGYNVTRQGVPFPKTIIRSLDLMMDGKSLSADEVYAFDYTPATPAGGVASELTIAPGGTGENAGFGCDAADYTGLNVTGRIVLIARGTCTFQDKSTVAKSVGAGAAIIYNNVANQGPISNQLLYNLSESIPTVSIGLETALPLVERLHGTGAPIITTLKLDSVVEDMVSYNIIAQTVWGNQSNVVQLGAHLDSVSAGPGINDNGSGSATLVELLVQLAKFKPSKNAVRFSWWSTEELGLIGSQYYVNALSEAEKAKIALYINLDMTASPNYIYGILDGDDSSGSNIQTTPPGSAALERLFQDDFNSKKIPWASYAFTGGSDYYAFAEAGIPSGGLATGAGGLKTEKEAAVFGGQAGVAYDECYHSACDTIDNLALDALLVNARSVAHVVATTAKSTAMISKNVSGRTRRKRATGGFGLVDLGTSCQDHHWI